MLMGAGLTYQGDLNWAFELPRDERQALISYLFARQERTGALFAQSLQPTDLVHILGGDGEDSPEGAPDDAMSSLLRQLDADPPSGWPGNREG